jgi:hypothetical protein
MYRSPAHAQAASLAVDLSVERTILPTTNHDAPAAVNLDSIFRLMLQYRPLMIPKYLATLALAVSLVTFAASSLQFATRSQVLAGKAVDETLPIEFTIDADSSQTYKIDPSIKQFLEDHISFYAEGSARVVSAKVTITPKNVSWTENRTTITSTGAKMAARLQWDTRADSANGAQGSIYINFPEVPGLEGKLPTFHSGGYQKDDKGRYVVREVTTYRDAFKLSLARFGFALAAGLPIGMLLHTIFWAFLLKGEKRSRLAEFPPQGSGLPRTFYPDPIGEWIVWLIVFGIGAFVASLMASFTVYDGFMSSTIIWVIYIMLAITVALALPAAYFTGKSLLTVRIDTHGISYARGRGDLEWLDAAWSDILQISQKSRTYRGSTSYWIELEFKDQRKKLKIAQSIEGYPALRDILMSVFTPK